jgi:hypothetical protein
VRLPDVPVNITVAVAVGALRAATNVVLCTIPGVRLNVAGFAVTPTGSPAIATATMLPKEFIAFAVTLTGDPAPPAVMINDVGASISEKSGSPVTVAATVAVWLSIPDVPVSINVALPATAAAPAVKVTLCAVPGVSVSIAGCAITPLGNPVIATVIDWVKPFTGIAFTLICCPAPPAASVIVAGIEDKEKSATGSCLDPPPQDVKTKTAKQRRKLQALVTFEKGLISALPANQGLSALFLQSPTTLTVHLSPPEVCHGYVFYSRPSGRLAIPHSSYFHPHANPTR